MTVTSYNPKLDRVKGRRNSAQSVPAATETTISWHTVDYDYSAADPGVGMLANTTQYRVYRNGFYSVVLTVDWSATTAGHYRQSRFYGTTAGTLATEVVVSGITSDFRTIFQLQWMGALGPDYTDDEFEFTVLSNAGISTTIGTSTSACFTMLRPL